MTLAEAAELLRLDAQTVRNKISRGIFKRGVHYFKREGEISVRFKRAALVAWLEGAPERKGAVIPMARGYAMGGDR